MYRKFYGLKGRPFNSVPDPGYLYLSPYHKDALAYLSSEVKKDSNPIIFTGDIGTGKTVLLRTFLKSLGPEIDLVQIMYRGNDRGQLLRMILHEMGTGTAVDSVDDLRSEVERHLRDLPREGRETFLVIDEAQELGEDALDEACLLSGLKADGRHLVRVILTGLPELREKVYSLSGFDYKDAITGICHLEALPDEEVIKYIHHRLAVAGCADYSVFPGDVLQEICRFSRGVPRLINMICDAALLYGYFSEKKVLTMPLLREVIADVFDTSGTEEGYPYETASVASVRVSADHDTGAVQEPVSSLQDAGSEQAALEDNGEGRTEGASGRDLCTCQTGPIPMTVLLLEKNARMRVRLEDRLRDKGVSTVVLSTIEELFKALDRFNDQGLQVLVADASFFFAKGGTEAPEGKEALDRIQRYHAYMPLIVTATLPLTVIRSKLFQRGISMLLHKPDLNHIDLSAVQVQFDVFFNELLCCLSNIRSQFEAICQKTIKWLTDSRGVTAASERRLE